MGSVSTSTARRTTAALSSTYPPTYAADWLAGGFVEKVPGKGKAAAKPTSKRQAAVQPRRP